MLRLSTRTTTTISSATSEAALLSTKCLDQGGKKARRQRNPSHNSKMGEDFFKNLPAEILLNILSRLPIPTTMSCKCVCTPWLELLSTPEFVKLRLSKSVQGLAVFSEGENSKPYKVVEFVDEEDSNCRWNTVLNLDLPFREPLHSSVDGVLFLCKQGCNARDLILCNPITREYIMLPSPRQPHSYPMYQLETYGFGVSKMSGQYKVVRLFLDEKLPLTPQFKCDQFECQIYTAGTGSWRRIISEKRHIYGGNNTIGAFLNGNLYWLAREGSSEEISCLDLETEVFSTFSPPPPPPDDDPHKSRNLSVLGDCLCVCDNSAYGWTSDCEIDIWLMKEYGDEKSWTKDFIIRKDNRDDFLGRLCAIKVFKDDDVLILRSRGLLYYSSKTKTVGEAEDTFGTETNVVAYAPSFLSLKTVATENVSSF